MSIVTISCRSAWTEWKDHPFLPCCDAVPEVFKILEGGKRKKKTETTYAQCPICGMEVYALAKDFPTK